MNNEQQELIDEVYERYSIISGMSTQVITLTKEEFIHYIRTDVKFSKTWGFKIEERELSRDERIDLYCKEYTGGTKGKYETPFDDFIDAKLTTRDIPNKLITITYKDKTITSYE
jgi:hypothetical protein